jgi:hypothetical protein
MFERSSPEEGPSEIRSKTCPSKISKNSRKLLISFFDKDIKYYYQPC